MQGSELVTSVRRLLADQEFDSDAILEAGNWFQDELCNNNRLRIMEESDTLSGAINDTAIDFPDDFHTLIEMYVTSPNIYSIKGWYRSYLDFTQVYADFATATPAQLHEWTDYGNAMRLARPLSAATTIVLDYIRIPTHVESVSDNYEIPTNYNELMAKGTLVRLMEQNEDYAEADQERKNLEPLVTAFIRNESRGQIKTGPNRIKTSMSGARGSRRYPTEW